MNDETRKQAAEDALEDLELRAEDASNVTGGDGEIARKAGKGQQEYLIIKMNDVIITGP